VGTAAERDQPPNPPRVLAATQFQVLHKWGKDDVFHAIQQHAKAAEAGDGDQKEYPDLLTPEWDIFTATPPLEPA
jgi:hypothetical protein